MSGFHRVPKWLACAVVFGAFMRLFMLGHQSLWVDEVGTWINVLHHESSIARFALYGNNAPPLYFWILYPVVQFFGDGEVGLRLLSAVSGIFTVPVFWLIARRLFPAGRVADVAVWLLALNPLHIWYSQEARPYAFFMLVFCGCCLLFLLAMDRSESLWRWVWLTLLMVLCALTHTLSVMLIPLFTGWFLCFQPSLNKLVRLLLCGGIFAAVAIPGVWLVRTVTEVAPPSRLFNGLEMVYTFFSFVAGYSFGPPVRTLQLLGPVGALGAHWPQAVVIVFLLGFIGVVAVRKVSWDFVPLYLWIGVPVLVSTGVALLTPHAYNVRFVLPALPGFLLLVAVLLMRLPRRFQIGVGSLLMGVFLLADLQWFSVDAYGKEDTRTAVQVVLRNDSNVRRIAVVPAYMADTVRYYVGKIGHSALVMPVEGEVLPAADAFLFTRQQHVPFIDSLKGQASVLNTEGFSVVGYEIVWPSPRE